MDGDKMIPIGNLPGKFMVKINGEFIKGNFTEAEAEEKLKANRPKREVKEKKEQPLKVDGWGGKGFEANLTLHYKIDMVKYNQFWDRQAGRCSGCKQEFAHPTKPNSMHRGLQPFVDHCHATGKVRGLLCRICNELTDKIERNHQKVINLLDHIKRNGDY